MRPIVVLVAAGSLALVGPAPAAALALHGCTVAAPAVSWFFSPGSGVGANLTVRADGSVTVDSLTAAVSPPASGPPWRSSWVVSAWSGTAMAASGNPGAPVVLQLTEGPPVGFRRLFFEDSLGPSGWLTGSGAWTLPAGAQSFFLGTAAPSVQPPDSFPADFAALVDGYLADLFPLLFGVFSMVVLVRGTRR
jgi:hypothetical protein